MAQKIKNTLIVLLSLVLVSCFNGNEESLGIVRNNVLKREEALQFLKNNSKLQFHVNPNHKVEQDYISISRDFLLKNIDSSFSKSSYYLKKGLMSEYSFVNYVLPYKVNSSMPHEWREKSLDLYTITEKKRNQCLDYDAMLSLSTDCNR